MSNSLAKLGTPQHAGFAGTVGPGSPAENAAKFFGDVVRGADVDPTTERYDAKSRTLHLGGLTRSQQERALRELARHPDAQRHIAQVAFDGGPTVRLPPAPPSRQ